MSEKCFFKNCSATIEDREKMKCSCLVCLGENQENCAKLCDTTEWLKQHIEYLLKKDDKNGNN